MDRVSNLFKSQKFTSIAKSIKRFGTTGLNHMTGSPPERLWSCSTQSKDRRIGGWLLDCGVFLGVVFCCWIDCVPGSTVFLG